jgi:small subunit ribosomal protein S6
MTVFAPDIPEEEIQTTIDRVVGYITTASGEVTEVNRDSPWGRRRLAYPIRHASRDVRDGFYTLYHFLVAPHRVDEIEREIKLNDRIMRHMVTQYTPRPVEETAPAEGEQAAEDTEGETPAVTETPIVASADVAAVAEEAPPAEAETTAEPEPEPEAVAEPDTVEETTADESADDGASTDEATPPEEA